MKRRMNGAKPDGRGAAGMRVVDIINVSSSAHSLLRERVLAMRARGIDNHIICMPGPYVASLREDGIPVHTAVMSRGLDPVRLLVGLVQITVCLARLKPDIVHTHCSIPGAIGRLAAWLARVPIIVHTVHGFHFHEDSPRHTRWLWVTIERLLGRITDALLTQNRADLVQAERYGIGPVQCRGQIGNGIDLERFRPAPHRNGSRPVVTLTCVARFESVKNHGVLLEACRLLKRRGDPFRLLLVGAGPLRDEYRRRCERFGIDADVEFLGHRDDVPDILASTDIAVLTSLKEGIPRSVLEAMAMGLPVVATDVHGTRELVRHGESGLLVRPDDVPGLAAALSLLVAEPSLRRRMGAMGRELVLEHHDQRDVIVALARLYLSIPDPASHPHAQAGGLRSRVPAPRSTTSTDRRSAT